MSKQPTVADYIVGRLAREGITDCFGVAGDFAFKLNDAVARSKTIRWIGCSNELDAAYAADGYARMRGCSMLLTTYAVGELSALNGVMGARAERSCVFHLVGMPTMRKQRVRQIVHHTLGDGEFQNFANISAQAACVSAVITPDNCAHEMERLIATARAESRPAYILVAADYAVTPVTATGAGPVPKPASGPDLAKAVAAIAERIQAARSVAVLPAYTVSRFKLQDSLRALIEALGCPFAAMPMERGSCPRRIPSSPESIWEAGRPPPSWRQSRVPTSSLTPAESASTRSTRPPIRASIEPEKLVTIGVDHVRIGDRIYNPVQMGDVFDGWPVGQENSATQAPPEGGSRETRRQARRPDHRSEHVPPLSRLPEAIGPDRPRERQHRVPGSTPLPLPEGAEVQFNRSGARSVGPPGPRWDRAGRSIAANHALHRGRLAPDDGRRRRDHGTQRAQADHLCPQQRAATWSSGARGKPGLGLQRPRPLELSCPARRPGLPGMVHGKSQHAR